MRPKSKLLALLVVGFYSFHGNAATFNNQLTLAQFGVSPNNNISLQPSSMYPFEIPTEIPRTNNYQSLELIFGDYATGRLPCRIGLFNVSECADSVGHLPFGSQLSLSSYVITGDPFQGIEPNRNILEVQDPNSVIFSFTESLIGVVGDLSESITGAVYTTTYEHIPMTSYMRNINLSPSGFHDVRYEDVTPKIVFGNGILTNLQVDGVNIPLPNNPTPTTLSLPAGTKFRFVLENPDQYPNQDQIWLIYAQSELGVKKIQFDMNYELTKDLEIFGMTLTSKSGPYVGYLRTAAIQTELPPALPNPLNVRTVPQWQLITQLQSTPTTPLSMFMLWPTSWTSSVGQQIILNQQREVFLSSCPTNSLLIPLLACYSPIAANSWYNQLIDKQNKGQVVFDIGTNSFVTLVNMYIAKYYQDDIQAFQNTMPRGISLPALTIGSDASIMENMFDTHRSEVLNSMDVEFNLDGSYQYYASTLDVIPTQPLSSSSLPLLCIPGYETLSDGFNIVNSSANRDPIKGDIIYVNGNVADHPGSFILKFPGQALPSWAEHFLPDDFWPRLQGSDKTNLICQLNSTLCKGFPGYIDDVYTQGRALFQIAMTAKYATYVLLAQQGFLPPYPGDFQVPQNIKQRVQPLITLIENILDTWLITRVFNGLLVGDYLVGDELGKGIVAYKGTTSSTGGVEDSGNAVYTGHNRQYGYFLASAAIAVQLDQLFRNSPWIASTKTNYTGTATATVKQFVDMLWRDYANPATDDSDNMPFYRYGNYWEGMSSSKGMPPVGAFPSRNNECISEDFNGYYGSFLYSRAIQSSPFSIISQTNQKGFDLLQAFSNANLAMITRAARALFYNTGNWVYSCYPFNFNYTTGTEWDNSVDSFVNLTLGYPACRFSAEGSLYSNYKFSLFGTDLVDQFNNHYQCSDEGCSCQK